MRLSRIYGQGEFQYRLRYALRTILRDRIVNEGAFNTCFEMEDGEQIVRAILLRGLKRPTLRAALDRSHLINLQEWLARHPDLASSYYDCGEGDLNCEEAD